MKILTSSQIREIDTYTIENESIASIDLMERAARQCFLRIKKLAKNYKHVKVFCGMGNNGGDGLAIARMLASSGVKVSVYKLVHAEKPSDDFAENEMRLQKLRKFDYKSILDSSNFPEIKTSDLVIDALFGSGLNRPLDGVAARLVQHINSSGASVVSIDIPSGLYPDDNSQNDFSAIIHASVTLTFQFPKLAFLFAENHQYVGQCEVLDIGLHPKAIEEASTSNFMLESSILKAFYQPRKPFMHKGHFGHALLIAGSAGKGGAAILAASAALRAGAGLLTARIPYSIATAMHVALPEAMVDADEDNNIITSPGRVGHYNAIGIGPGVGTDPKTANVMKLLLQEFSGPLVIDADAINILAENPTWLSLLPAGSILTPHAREFERLTRKHPNSHNRLEAAKHLCVKHNIFIVLKGAYTAVVCPDRKVFFNPTGNPGMATAGSGDALTGIILGWLAQGYTPLQGALAAVYLHGLAGDIAAKKQGQQGLIASDIIFNLGKAAKKIFD